MIQGRRGKLCRVAANVDRDRAGMQSAAVDRRKSRAESRIGSRSSAQRSGGRFYFDGTRRVADPGGEEHAGCLRRASSLAFGHRRFEPEKAGQGFLPDSKGAAISGGSES